VLKLLFLTLFLTLSLFGEKILYTNYETIPKRVIKGEIFTVTLKSLSTRKEFNDIEYTFFNGYGIELLDEVPLREERGRFFYDTFHMLVTQSQAKLPDVNATLILSVDPQPIENNQTQTVLEEPSAFEEPSVLEESQEKIVTTIFGEKLNVITLNPRKDFSSVIANSFALQEYKTTSYDKSHNIVIFVATATNADLKAIHFNNVYKQGIESLKESYEEAKVTYYVVIDKHLEAFRFSYFNLLKNDYETITIPIVVDDDSVSTQSDLKPRDQSHDTIKIYIALGVVGILLLIALLRRRFIYAVIALLPLGYVLYLSIPQQKICIKKGSKIYLLPVRNATVFETTPQEYHLQKEGSVQHFIKVKLQNDKIGWVKNEDTCTY